MQMYRYGQMCGVIFQGCLPSPTLVAKSFQHPALNLSALRADPLSPVIVAENLRQKSAASQTSSTAIFNLSKAGGAERRSNQLRRDSREATVETLLSGGR